MRTIKIKLLIIFFIVVSFVSIRNATPQELETVKVSFQPNISRAPILIAYEEGFFKEQGINLELVKVQGVAEALLLLAGGSLDVIFMIPTAGIYNAVKESKNLKLVAGMTYLTKGLNLEGIAVRGDLKDIKNLKGKRIANPTLGSLAHYFIEVMLERNGMLFKDIELVLMPFPSIVESINKGTLDAGVLTEPFITLLKSKAKISLISFDDEFSGMPYIFIIYGPRFLAKNPELGVKFMVSYLKGWQQYSQGKTARNIEILKKYIELDEEMLKKIGWPVIYPEGIFDSKEILSGYQDWLFKKNYLDKKIPVEAMIDTSFIEQANSILHSAKE